LISIASKAQLERDAHGAPLRMISAIVDITQRKQLEADLLQSQKLESIGQLAGGVAHDFNNLLTIILGQASLLSTMASLPTAVRESARDIEMAAERAAALTAQLLAFGRRQFLQLRVLDINGVVSETLKMLTRVVGDRVTIRFEPDESPLPVRADATAIAQILLNLTLNARDAMPQGGVCTVRTLLEQGDASAHAREQTNDDRDAKGPWACLVVSDTGLGIAPNVLPHIFDPFFTTKDIGKGSGLGLSTVYGIARQHRGFVTVATTLGKGSAFKVFLPRDASEIDVVVAVPPSPKAGRGEQILVVEDEPGVRLLLMSTLARHGYQPVSAESGADALRVWRERGPVFALVFTDMAMPGDMNGLELVEALRSQEPSLKAIISSGYSQEIVATELSARSAQSFLQKPWSAEQLLSAIRDMLDREG
jgi:signal transduction histidine kinase/CheY-like chemotaxis protein